MRGPIRLAIVAASSILLVMTAGTGGAEAAGPVLHCGDTITTSITLRNDLRCAGDGLVVAADGVRINLNGHRLTGSGTGAGIRDEEHAGLAVGDGAISGFAQGIALDTVRDVSLTGVRLLHNGLAADWGGGQLRIRGGEFDSTGWAVAASGYDSLVMDGAKVTGGVLADNVHGAASRVVNSRIRAGDLFLMESAGFTIRGNTFVDGGASSSESGGLVIEDNRFTNGGVGLEVTDDVLLRRNTISGGGISIDFGPCRDIRVLANTVRGARFGVYVKGQVLAEFEGMVISGNRLTGNSVAGVFLTTSVPFIPSGPVTVAGNTLRHNGYGPDIVTDSAGRRVNDGLHTDVPVGSGLLVRGNRTYGNADFGIEALPAGSVRDGGGNLSRGDRSGCVGVTCR
ncbi:right-handed parallel beta-helix repeat-containing protein [Plantactinospora siamensis]|uniref:Right-handed parallel beta-helix repeat-containing protein n=1 Tax=Plantactinospora siamensis TaxID=555372 RepID=A0ABV6NQY6_9ACTN